MTRANLGEFLAVFAVPPRATIGSGSPADGRSRSAPDGHPDTSATTPLADSNLIVERIVHVIELAVRAGSQYALCGLSDYGDITDPRLYLGPDHVPLWLLSPVRRLATSSGGRSSTFAMCNYGAPRQDYTTLLYSPGLASRFARLDRDFCSHLDHSGTDKPSVIHPPLSPRFSVLIGDALASLCEPVTAIASFPPGLLPETSIPPAPRPATTRAHRLVPTVTAPLPDFTVAAADLPAPPNAENDSLQLTSDLPVCDELPSTASATSRRPSRCSSPRPLPSPPSLQARLHSSPPSLLARPLPRSTPRLRPLPVPPSPPWPPSRQSRTRRNSTPTASATTAEA
jgi:hypothetical protein